MATTPISVSHMYSILMAARWLKEPTTLFYLSTWKKWNVYQMNQSVTLIKRDTHHRWQSPPLCQRCGCMTWQMSDRWLSPRHWVLTQPGSRRCCEVNLWCTYQCCHSKAEHTVCYMENVWWKIFIVWSTVLMNWIRGTPMDWKQISWAFCVMFL